MPNPLAIVGPGRVGAALARRWAAAGVPFLGFLGRDAARTAAALEFVGAGRALEPSDLEQAAVVGLAVPDDGLDALVGELVGRGAVRRSALWFHTSGAFGLEPLQPLAGAGARIGALHPLGPVPDRAAGVQTLAGRHALIEADENALPLLRQLAKLAGLEPLVADGAVDRPLYHAACALAANGTTALLGLAIELLARAASIPSQRAAAVIGDLGGAAAGLVAERGAADALSGPVARGDAATVVAHLNALARAPRADAGRTYRAVMAGALALARARGLAPELAARIEAVLDGEGVA